MEEGRNVWSLRLPLLFNLLLIQYVLRLFLTLLHIFSIIFSHKMLLSSQFSKSVFIIHFYSALKWQIKHAYPMARGLPGAPHGPHASCLLPFLHEPCSTQGLCYIHCCCRNISAWSLELIHAFSSKFNFNFAEGKQCTRLLWEEEDVLRKICSAMSLDLAH